MAIDAGTVYIDVRPDTSQFGRTLGRDMSRSRSRFSSLGKNIGLGIAGGMAAGVVAAGAGITKFVQFALSESAAAQKVAAQTAAVIKSTGGAANVTAREVDRLASSLAKKTGIDDEAIASAQNLLLTFTNVRNETGKGNAIFDRATKSILDVSTAMNIDLQSASKMVGKALNDPVLGMTALGRAGVQFTKAQKDQVKAMVEAGDAAGAQRLILKELEKQTGGSAKAAGDTFTGSMNKLKVAFGDLGERLGNKLMPHIQRFADYITANMPKIQRFVMQAFKTIVQWVQDSLVPALQSFGDWWRRNGGTIISWAGKIGRFIGGLFRGIGETIGNMVEAFNGAKFAIQLGVARVKFFFADMAERVLAMAARAFSWIPGLGPKLERAHAGIKKFRDRANEQLRKVESMQLKVEADEARRDLNQFIKDYAKKKIKLPMDVYLANVQGDLGDGPGAPIGPGGKAIDRARQAAVGLPVTMTSSYRSPARNAAVGGSPTSYHLDYSNPASDWVGPTWALDEMARRLRMAGRFRELLWRVPNHAPGDNPHVHYAERGFIAKKPSLVLMGESAKARRGGAEVAAPLGMISDAMRGVMGERHSTGPVTFNLYDADRVLLGTIRGEVARGVDGQARHVADALAYGRA